MEDLVDDDTKVCVCVFACIVYTVYSNHYCKCVGVVSVTSDFLNGLSLLIIFIRSNIRNR